METRPLVVDRTDAWAIHDCLQAQLAGFGGRSETAEPWHGLSLLAQVRFALLKFEASKPPLTIELHLSRGELECIDLNIPRTAYQGAVALLLRVFHALEELKLGFALNGEEPERGDQERRMANWRRDHGTDPSIPA